MYLENRILKKDLKGLPEAETGRRKQKARQTRHPRDDEKKSSKKERRKKEERTNQGAYHARYAKMVKLERAQGGCLGTKSRRKT